MSEEKPSSAESQRGAACGPSPLSGRIREELCPGLWQFEDETGQLYLAVKYSNFRTAAMARDQRLTLYSPEYQYEDGDIPDWSR